LKKHSCKRGFLIASSARNDFMDAAKSKTCIAFLRLVHNPADEASLDRIINVPPRGIGEKTLTTLHMVARQNETSPRQRFA
jgi:superfamily I DNA/RNA helicase